MPCQQNSTGAASTIPNPYVEAKTVEDTKSSVALVYRKVLSPLRADNTGPNIESGPIQYNRMAVLSPSDSLLSLLPLDLRSTNCLNLPSKSIIKHMFIFVLDSLMEKGTQCSAYDDCGNISNGS